MIKSDKSMIKLSQLSVAAHAHARPYGSFALQSSGMAHVIPPPTPRGLCFNRKKVRRRVPSPRPPPPGRCFNFHSGRGGDPSPLDPLPPSPRPPPPPPPSALIRLRIRVLGTFFHLGHFFPPAPSAHL